MSMKKRGIFQDDRDFIEMGDSPSRFESSEDENSKYDNNPSKTLEPDNFTDEKEFTATPFLLDTITRASKEDSNN